MSLDTCTDCHQPVSSEAVACPTCGRPMRNSSSLTPGAQALVGGLVLVACIAWPPLFFIVLLISVARFAARARRGGKRNVIAAVGLLVPLTFALIWMLPPSWAPIVCVLGGGTVVWLVAPRLTRSASTS